MTRRLKPARVFDEMLVKAVRIKDKKGTITVVDATGGLGEDSLILAAAGCRVTVFERGNAVFRLLEDTVKRALLLPELAEIVCRMDIRNEDSIASLGKLSESPDVVFLDPMFPEKNKGGMTNKKLQVIRSLETPCEEEEELMAAAISAKPIKIVVKRPSKGPWLANRKPSYSIGGKTIRYDIYFER